MRVVNKKRKIRFSYVVTSTVFYVIYILYIASADRNTLTVAVI